jgi:hypothetical protein
MRDIVASADIGKAVQRVSDRYVAESIKAVSNTGTKNTQRLEECHL